MSRDGEPQEPGAPRGRLRHAFAARGGTGPERRSRAIDPSRGPATLTRRFCEKYDQGVAYRPRLPSSISQETSSCQDLSQENRVPAGC